VTVFAPAQPPAHQLADLRAVTVELEGAPVDLVRVAGEGGVFWQRDGAGLAGRGMAATLEAGAGMDGPAARDLAAALGQVETSDQVTRPGTGPVAIGALPFDPTAPGRLVIPSLLVGRDTTGHQWVTVVAPENAGGPLGPGGARRLVEDIARPRPGEPKVWSPDRFSLDSPLSHEEWCRVVTEATEAIGRGELHKVVLAREIVVAANRPFVLGDILRRLLLLHPSCMVFAVDGFVGASPELLVGRRGPEVRSHPLAGTISRSGDRATDEALSAGLLASAKDRHEHGLVVDAVADGLRPFCERLEVPAEPAIVALRNVAHLGTELVGTLGTIAPSWALDLVAALHPTPAVGGTPTAPALEFLRHHERLDRGRYAGPVGWMDRRGDGDWAVGIRSAEVSGATARLFAGVGVVAGSDPEDELAETQLKLQALLAALVRP